MKENGEKCQIECALFFDLVLTVNRPVLLQPVLTQSTALVFPTDNCQTAATRPPLDHRGKCVGMSVTRVLLKRRWKKTGAFICYEWYGTCWTRCIFLISSPPPEFKTCHLCRSLFLVITCQAPKKGADGCLISRTWWCIKSPTKPSQEQGGVPEHFPFWFHFLSCGRGEKKKGEIFTDSQARQMSPVLGPPRALSCSDVGSPQQKKLGGSAVVVGERPRRAIMIFSSLLPRAARELVLSRARHSLYGINGSLLLRWKLLSPGYCPLQLNPHTQTHSGTTSKCLFRQEPEWQANDGANNHQPFCRSFSTNKNVKFVLFFSFSEFILTARRHWPFSRMMSRVRYESAVIRHSWWTHTHNHLSVSNLTRIDIYGPHCLTSGTPWLWHILTATFHTASSSRLTSVAYQNGKKKRHPFNSKINAQHQNRCTRILSRFQLNRMRAPVPRKMSIPSRIGLMTVLAIPHQKKTVATFV